MITRLLAPCFDACLLTFASPDRGAPTAPGQIGVREMVDKYGIDRVSGATEVQVCVYTGEDDETAVRERCGGDGRRLRLPLRVEPREVGVVTRALPRLDPRVSLIDADALLTGRASWVAFARD